MRPSRSKKMAGSDSRSERHRGWAGLDRLRPRRPSPKDRRRRALASSITGTTPRSKDDATIPIKKEFFPTWEILIFRDAPAKSTNTDHTRLG